MHVAPTVHVKQPELLWFHSNQAYIIWQITMKRQSLLYIVNFLLPILFLLSLDIASFFISEREGEKLSFKVTVLLAVTVMQLLLNEILPSSSDRIPLIGKAKEGCQVWLKCFLTDKR